MAPEYNHKLGPGSTVGKTPARQALHDALEQLLEEHCIPGKHGEASVVLKIHDGGIGDYEVIWREKRRIR